MHVRIRAVFKFLCLAFLGWSPAAAGGERGPADLASRFRDPPSDRRILQIIHNFPSEPAQRAEQIERFRRQGFGGLVVNVNFRDYLRSEQRWEEFRAGVEAARAAGMTLWLYDEEGYPSGAAGGLVLEGHPEWEARGLFAVVRDIEDGKEAEVVLLPGEVVSAAAYPLRGGEAALGQGIDLRDAVGADRRLRWGRPGSWRICAFVEARLYEGTHAEGNLHRKRPYPNLLEPGAMERFVELTHGAYEKRCAPLAARFEAIFTDEPSLLNVFLREMPFPALPWSSGLAAAFRRLKGYDLVPVLPALAADFGPAGKKVRCDFWDVVGRELAANYFGRIQDWCRARGIASTGHLLSEEDLGTHVGFYGNFFACARRLDFPGIDCLTSDPATVPWHVAKLLGSAACLEGRPKAMSETSDFAQRWRPPGDGRPARNVSAAEVLGTTHLLYVAGINTTTSYYAWAGLKEEEIQAVNEAIGRLGTVLEGGEHVAEVAVLYPVESLWSVYTPQRLWARSGGVDRIDGIYRDALSVLFRAQRDFDIVDSGDLAASRLEGAALRIGRERFRILVLPAVSAIPIEALRKAAALAGAGGAVVAVGDVPASTPGAFPDEEARRIAAGLFGDGALGERRDEERLRVRDHAAGGRGIYLPGRSAWLLPDVLDRILEPDLKAPRGSPLRYTHRKKDGRDFYLLVNDSGRPCAETVFLRGEGPAELWDPSSGKIGPLQPAAGGGFPISLPAYGSAFIAFPKARDPGPVAPGAPIAGMVVAVPVEKAAPAPPSFEVRSPAHVKARAERKGALLPARVAARIDEGGKDSWCFGEVLFQKPADLSRFRALDIETRVPPGQESFPKRLVAILLEENEAGSTADYLAEPGRALGVPGSERSSLPFDSFRLAGWSRDPDGRLDLSRIRAIRIGWGGHTGRAGEEVAFGIDIIEFLGIAGMR